MGGKVVELGATIIEVTRGVDKARRASASKG